MHSNRSWLVSLSVGGLLLALSACGESGPPKSVVKGTITNAGKVIPIKITESKSGEFLRVWLKEANPGKLTDSYNAIIKFEDGTFTIPGGDGRGVPAGKYKVFIEWNDNFPMGKDLLKGRFSEANSKILRDIPPPNGVLNIDVSKPEG